jgi:hypothetical protein
MGERLVRDKVEELPSFTYDPTLILPDVSMHMHHVRRRYQAGCMS